MRSHRSGVAAVLISFLAAAALGDEIARANLNILGISLEVDRATVATGIDIPVAVQTIYGGKKNDDAHPPPDLSVLGDLTGAALDTPLTLATKPGRQFQIPALHQGGEYVLQNIRLVRGDGHFIQQAIPSFANITVADVLKTSVRVRQLSADELRARGLNLDARNFDVFVKIAELDVPNFDAVAGALDGTTLYLAGGEAGIAVVDLTNPASPVWKGTAVTPGIARAVGITSPTEIVVADAGGPGLTFLDTSDRSHPIVLGSQPLQGNPTDVKVIGNRIYVATETRSYVVTRP